MYDYIKGNTVKKFQEKEKKKSSKAKEIFKK